MNVVAIHTRTADEDDVRPVETIQACAGKGLEGDRYFFAEGARPGLALKPNGPVRVSGGVPIEAEGADPFTEDRISLCRCGASRSQPVCDGSHKIVGYREPPEPGGPSPQPGL